MDRLSLVEKPYFLSSRAEKDAFLRRQSLYRFLSSQQGLHNEWTENINCYTIRKACEKLEGHKKWHEQFGQAFVAVGVHKDKEGRDAKKVMT